MMAVFDDIEEMAELARSLVCDSGVKVERGNYWPSADVQNRIIRLPDLRVLPSEMRPKFGRMLRGWFYHEVAHLWFTTLPYFQALHGRELNGTTTDPIVARALRCYARWGSLFSYIAVTVEDVRVDQLLVESRPGLARCMQKLAEEENDPLPEALARLADNTPLARLAGAVLLIGRKVTTAERLPDAVIRLIDIVRPAFEVAVQPRTPDDVIEAAVAMLVTLEPLAEDATRSSTLLAHTPETDALDLFTTPDEGSHGCTSVAETLGTLIDQAKAAAAETGWISPVPLDDIDDLDDDFDDEGPARPYKVLSKGWDEIVRFSQEERVILSADFARDCRAARAAVGPLIDGLAVILTLEASDELLLGQDVGVGLDPSAYCRLQLDAAPQDVWMDVRTSGALDAVVMLLVDCSGSMRCIDDDTGIQRDALARVCTTALHLTLKPAGVPHAVYGFTTSPSNPPQLIELEKMRCALGEDLSLYARTTTAAKYYCFKPFESEDARALARIRGECLNLDGEAIALATAALCARSESLKLLFVLSDGQPSGARHGPTEEAYLRQAVRDADRAGIRVIGIGIGDPGIHAYYPEWMVVYRLRELPGRLLTALQWQLLER